MFRIYRLLTLMLGAIVALSTCTEPEKPKPEITLLTPASGAVGDQVTITGKNLQGTENINFGSVSIKGAAIGESSIITAVPPTSIPGQVNVTVKSEGGTSNALPFIVLHSIPEITSINPDKASTGMEIFVNGKHLATAESLSIGDKLITTFISKTDDIVKFNVPEGLALGAHDVIITTLGGASEKATFTIVGKPTITTLTPAIGPALRQVNIAGTYLEDATKVLFNTAEATFIVKSPTLIEATVPASASTGKVKVTTPGGEALSPVDFVLKDGPEVTSFVPTKGFVNEEITITGKNFDAGGTAVKFGTGKATSVTVVSATQIRVKVPAAATSGAITVETVAGSGLSIANFTVIGAPVVTSFSPLSGSVNQEVTISGTDFISVTSVKFNSTVVTAGNYTVVSATQIKAKVPTGASSGKISVATPSGSDDSPTDFVVIGPPTITSFTPANGAVASSVVINGTNFTGTSSVKFNGVSVAGADLVVNSSVKITAKVPTSATSGKITVTTPLGTATSATNFNVTPFISTLNPTTGAAGSSITITGTNLDAAKVYFGATQVTPTNNTTTSITATVPGAAIGAVNVTVVNAGGTSNAKTFTILSTPVLDEIIASQNITGQLILLKGSNLTGATVVTFGNVETPVLTATAKVVTAIIPASLSVGSYEVTTTSPKGTSNPKNFDLLSDQNPETGQIALYANATITSLPPNYVPPIANAWANNLNSEERFFLSGSGQSLIVSLQSAVLFEEGFGVYDLANVDGVLNNYIEFTILGVRYAGSWTPPSNFNSSLGKYCNHHLTLISAESGRVLSLTVEDPDCN